MNVETFVKKKPYHMHSDAANSATSADPASWCKKWCQFVPVLKNTGIGLATLLEILPKIP